MYSSAIKIKSKLNMKVSLHVVEMSINGRNEKNKKGIWGDASISINQIVSKLGMGTSFTHNVYFYTTLPPKNKVFVM